MFISYFFSLFFLSITCICTQYECFNSDFFDQNANTKEILETLNASMPINNLNLNSSGQILTTELSNVDQSNQTISQGNQKYTDYIDGKCEGGLMSSLWTIDISSKNSPFLSELASDLESRYWENKPPDQWTSEDVWHWIFSWASDRNVDVEDVQPLAYANMTGQQLCQMSKNDFILMNPKYGSHIHETLNQLINQFRK